MAKKYVSIINDGTEDFDVKDAEARTLIEGITGNVASVAESISAANELT